jgi:hypothetical protein
MIDICFIKFMLFVVYIYICWQYKLFLLLYFILRPFDNLNHPLKMTNARLWNCGIRSIYKKKGDARKQWTTVMCNAIKSREVSKNKTTNACIHTELFRRFNLEISRKLKSFLYSKVKFRKYVLIASLDWTTWLLVNRTTIMLLELF